MTRRPPLHLTAQVTASMDHLTTHHRPHLTTFPGPRLTSLASWSVEDWPSKELTTTVTVIALVEGA
ncbi:MAG: hypothetical protein LBH48_06075 [Bifidobacteriaceae bacterium]|nr:hypothetical protein [Bifidobacteriaceae bacterium]